MKTIVIRPVKIAELLRKKRELAKKLTPEIKKRRKEEHERWSEQ